MTNKVGRPTSYTKKMAEEICDAIAESGKGIQQLCDDNEHFPCERTVFRWLNKHEEFSQQYAIAKIKQVEYLVNEINVMMNEPHYYMEDGVRRIDAKILRTKIDTRKWLASKLVPKVYGDKAQSVVTVINHEEALEELE